MFVIGWIFKKQFLIRFNCWLFFIPCYKVCNPFQMTGSIYISFLSCPIDVITECLWSAKQFSHSSPIGWTIFTFFFYWLNNFHILLLLAQQFQHSSPIGWTVFTFFSFWLNSFHILLLLAEQFSHCFPIGWKIFTFFFYWLNNFHILLLLAEQFSHSFLLAEQFCGGLLVSYCLTGQLNCNTKLFFPQKVHVWCTKA